MARFLPVLLLFLLDLGSSSSSCPDGSVHISLSGNQWSCFKFVNQVKEFFLADLDCQQQNGHLVSIHNGFENLYIAEYAGSTFDTNDRYWIGVNSLKANVWTYNDDGSNVTFVDWASGQPAVNAGQQGCASSDSQGYWYSDDCFAAKYYVCELPNGGGQTQTTVTPRPRTRTSTKNPATTGTASNNTSSSERPTTPTTTTPLASSPTSTPTPEIAVCRSAYIPFCYDVSSKPTPAEFKALKNALLDPFLSRMFPLDVRPAVFCTYDTEAYSGRRQENVTGVSNYVQFEGQGTVDDSIFAVALDKLIDEGVLDYGDHLPVNTVIFAGVALASYDAGRVQNSTDVLTRKGNTLSVVLLDPGVDAINYRRISGLNVLVWTDALDTMYRLRSVMKCL